MSSIARCDRCPWEFAAPNEKAAAAALIGHAKDRHNPNEKVVRTPRPIPYPELERPRVVIFG